MTTKKISIADEFTKYPGLRYKRLTPGSSAEEFRDQFIIPLLEKYDSLEVVLDGNIAQYIPSFLEECFAGLIRIKKYSMEEFKSKVRIVSVNKPELIDEIIFYVKREIK